MVRFLAVSLLGLLFLSLPARAAQPAKEQAVLVIPAPAPSAPHPPPADVEKPVAREHNKAAWLVLFTLLRGGRPSPSDAR